MRSINKVLVTGGCGFIGSHIIEELVNKGKEIHVIDNFSTGNLKNLSNYYNNPLIHIYNGDISLIQKFIKDIDIDIVFHQAAIASVSKSIIDPLDVFDTNVSSSLKVLEYCRNSNVGRIVFASSSSVYGDQGNNILNEIKPCYPLSPYGASKLSIENYLYSYWKSYGLESVSLRYFNVYGPRQTNNEYSGVITVFINKILNGKPIVIHGDGRQTRDFVNIKDIVQANMLAAESKNVVGEVLNIGTGKGTSILELFNILSIITKNKDIKYLSGNNRIGDIRHSIADITKAKSLINYSPTIDIEKGLEELFQWYNK